MDHLSIRTEATLGAGLMTTPFWVSLLNNIGWVASIIAAVCGAIVGIHAVWRIWSNRKKPDTTAAKKADEDDLDILAP